ncbi:MAG: RHS repeat-associated core domain-containing protein, partial [Bacilli bacterium]|nr:RHS repeat-associated core domain-containing protein [Bacilli bacterium]
TLISFHYDNNINDAADGEEYFYIKNQQGDITAIVNNIGVVQVEYRYDGWGNILSVDTPSGSTLDPSINVYTYRGYRYDYETSLYYCNSRYYNPEWGRWLNADDVSYLDPSSVNGLNLYAYCNNNPVMYYDPDGHLALFTLFLISSIVIGAAVGGGISGYTSYKAGERGLDLAGDIIGGALMGGALGAAMALGGAAGLASTGITVAGFGLSTTAALGIAIGTTAAAGMAHYSLNTLGSKTDNWQFGKMLLAGVEGGAQGAATFGLAYFGGKNGMFANKLARMSPGDFMQYACNTYGRISTGTSLVYATSFVFSSTVTNFVFLNAPGMAIRWLIDQTIYGV